MAATSLAPVGCLTRDELVQKVYDLQQGLSELSLKELGSHREEMKEREQALDHREARIAQREAEVARREGEVARREEACGRQQQREGRSSTGSTSGGSLAAAAAQSVKDGLSHLELGSPGAMQAMMTPTPARSHVPPMQGGAFGGGRQPNGSPMPPMPTTVGSHASTTSSPSKEESLQPLQPMHHQPWRMPQRSPQASPAPSASSASASAYTGGQLLASPLPAQRRLSGPGNGSASKLKAMFEQRPTNNIRSGSMGVGGIVSARGARRTAPPTTTVPTAAAQPASSQPPPRTPAPKVSLSELLRADEVATTEAAEVRPSAAEAAALAAGFGFGSTLGSMPADCSFAVTTDLSSADMVDEADLWVRANSSIGNSSMNEGAPDRLTPSSLTSSSQPRISGGLMPRVSLQELLRRDEA
mmetsp:Transcript_26033/g.84052  ORF Transcript_26033/g.84052 Transcript_26033/m.84052 type:complete len:415 (+) Transcript_26033:108-1352(+)